MDKEAQEKGISNLLLSNLPHDVGSMGSTLAIPSRVAWCDEMAKRIIERGYRKPLATPEMRKKIDEIFDTYDADSPISRGRVISEILALIVPKDKQHEQKGARAFLGLPIEERRKILAIQAQSLADTIADSQAKEGSKMMD